MQVSAIVAQPKDSKESVADKHFDFEFVKLILQQMFGDNDNVLQHFELPTKY